MIQSHDFFQNFKFFPHLKKKNYDFNNIFIFFE